MCMYIYIHMSTLCNTDTSRVVTSQRLRHARAARPSDGGKAARRCPGGRKMEDLDENVWILLSYVDYI